MQHCNEPHDKWPDDSMTIPLTKIRRMSTYTRDGKVISLEVNFYGRSVVTVRGIRVLFEEPQMALKHYQLCKKVCG